MPIDPRIALGVQPLQLQQPDPNQGMNALARIMQIQGMQDERQMNRLKMDEYKRGLADQESLRNDLSAPDADPYNVLLRRGRVKEATDFQKAQADAEKNKIDAERLRVDTAHKRVDSWGQAMGFVRQNPTPENAVAAVRHLVTMGILPQEQAQAALAGVGNDPQSITRWATQGFQAALSAKDQLPKYETRNLGGTTQTTAIDPVTGQLRVVNSVANTQSPDSAASVAEQRRAHNMADARSRENNEIQRSAARSQVINDPVQGPMLVDKGTGAARPVTMGGQPVAGEQPAKAKAGAQRMIPVIEEAERLIDQATGSYVGAGVDLAGRAVGQSTKGADAIARLKVLEGQLMMAQPRMEGPQSNLDVQLYRQMAGQIGDPTVPPDMKRAALATIKQLQQRYAGASAPAAPAAPNAPAAAPKIPRISGDAEYNALPSGATFVGPDGKQRRKP